MEYIGGRKVTNGEFYKDKIEAWMSNSYNECDGCIAREYCNKHAGSCRNLAKWER